MKGSYEFTDTDNISATLTVTMKISEWKNLKDQLLEKYPAWKFASMIQDMVCKAEGIIETKHDVLP